MHYITTVIAATKSGGGELGRVYFTESLSKKNEGEGDKQ